MEEEEAEVVVKSRLPAPFHPTAARAGKSTPKLGKLSNPSPAITTDRKNPISTITGKRLQIFPGIKPVSVL